VSGSQRCFFDTCVLIYALIEQDHRTVTAERLIIAGGEISAQVLNELASAGRQKFKLRYDEIASLSRAAVELCGTPHPLTLKTHEGALAIAQRYGFHFYDSLIVASALDSGCATLYSEDMQHGQKIGSLTIVNPFVEGGLTAD
jgi:predicted nucleic acid-binding protein